MNLLQPKQVLLTAAAVLLLSVVSSSCNNPEPAKEPAADSTKMMPAPPDTMSKMKMDTAPMMHDSSKMKKMDTAKTKPVKTT